MCSLTPPRPRSKSAPPVRGQARWLLNNLLTGGLAALAINGQCYWLTVFADGEKVVGFRLTKEADGMVYDVNATAEHWTCDCPDYQFRRANVDPKGCKHVAAIRAAIQQTDDLPPAVKAVVRW